MSHHGWLVTTSIHDQDALTSEELNLSSEAIQASIRAELGTELAWKELQSQHGTSQRIRLIIWLRRLYRSWQFNGLTRTSQKRGQDMLKRLANIEVAHMSLLKQAAQEASDWALILEDDAYAPDVTALGSALDQHLNTWQDTRQPQYINISESFPLAALNLSHTLKGVEAWDEHGRVYSSQVPFTNTVCAVLYRGSFLQNLHNAMSEIPLEPVIPIDWKLNRAIMDLVENGQLGAHDCYVIEPAPIRQGSMHTSASTIAD
jgi:hypothetical protein